MTTTTQNTTRIRIVDVEQISDGEFLVWSVNRSEVRVEYIRLDYPRMVQEKGYMWDCTRGRWLMYSRTCGITPLGRLRTNTKAYKAFFAHIDGRLKKIIDATGHSS